MADDLRDKLKKKQTRSYLNKDFDGFKSDLLLYARTFFDGQIQDFSEASVGGLFLDMAAYVGDVMSYYLDHQLSELNIETAVETKNLEKIIKSAGVKITGASPAIVDIDFYISVPADPSSPDTPKAAALPVIQAGTVVSSNGGVLFELIEDVDFSEKDSEGKYLHLSKVVTSGSPPVATSYLLKNGRGVGQKQQGTCKSGKIIEEKFNVPNTFVAFRTITLASDNVSEILSVSDTEKNRYYEVESLSQNIVYNRVLNVQSDSFEVPENIELLPAPYRFIVNSSRQTGLTTLRFGSGHADSLDDDIVPDPSELSLPLYGKQTFSRFSIDPNNLLRTSTLGVSPQNTTMTIRYRAGGGLSHNVASNTIRSVTGLSMRFGSGAVSSDIVSVRASLEINNPEAARGGENPPTLNELRSHVLSARFAQSRIVSKEDLIARIYTMPSNFGRVFRVGIRSSIQNPLSTQLYIISRNKVGQLAVSPDSLKENLVTFINQHRLISDAVDILDVQVVNVGAIFNITVGTTYNKRIVLQNINNSLKAYLDIKNFQVDQPIIVTDLITIILNQAGVTSLADFSMTNIFIDIQGRNYSNIMFDVSVSGPNYDRGILYGPPGSIFECRYPDDDIVGNAL
tara:strand:+ start:4295 stop:6169 length:1875 start_codon:yes stop_codon:yes gene_type:complete